MRISQGSPGVKLVRGKLKTITWAAAGCHSRAMQALACLYTTALPPWMRFLLRGSLDRTGARARVLALRSHPARPAMTIHLYGILLLRQHS